MFRSCIYLIYRAIGPSEWLQPFAEFFDILKACVIEKMRPVATIDLIFLVLVTIMGEQHKKFH